MKQSIKFLFIALLSAPLFFLTSCEENLETSCDDFSISIDVSTNDSLSVTLTALTEGGVPEFSYLWNTGDATESISVNDYGTYSVTVTDADDCVASVDFVVEQDTSGTECNGFSSYITEDIGTASSFLNAFAEGGTEPFTYVWSTNEVGQFIEVDIPGDYSVVITDANGCTTTSTYTYVQGGGLCDYDVSIVAEFDTSNNSTLLTVIIDTAGVGPFTYVWSEGSTDSFISVFSDGVYSVVVTDANGCVFNLDYTVDTSPCANFDLDIQATLDSMSMEFILSPELSGGTAPYTYQWSTNELTETISVPSGSGGYQLTVVDANGCLAEDQIQL